MQNWVFFLLSDVKCSQQCFYPLSCRSSPGLLACTFTWPGGLSVRWKPLLRNVNQRNRNALVDSLTHACWPIVRSVRRLLVFVFRRCYNCVTINGRHYFVCRWTGFALSKAEFTFYSRRQTDRQAVRSVPGAYHLTKCLTPISDVELAT